MAEENQIDEETREEDVPNLNEVGVDPNNPPKRDEDSMDALKKMIDDVTADKKVLWTCNEMSRLWGMKKEVAPDKLYLKVQVSDNNGLIFDVDTKVAPELENVLASFVEIANKAYEKRIAEKEAKIKEFSL